MKAKTIIPNLFTISNLIFGMMAIFTALTQKFHINYSILFLLAAIICDFIDGFAARILKANSEFGKQLDSLSDVVSFGVAPAFIAYVSMQNYTFAISNCIFFQITTILVPAIFAAATAIRLAKFNLDQRQTQNFIGIPSPAAALFTASTNIFWLELFGIKYAVIFALIQTFLFAILMLIPIPLISLKLKEKRSIVLAILTFISIVLAWLYYGIPAGIPMVILLYIVVSSLILVFSKKANKHTQHQ